MPMPTGTVSVPYLAVALSLFIGCLGAPRIYLTPPHQAVLDTLPKNPIKCQPVSLIDATSDDLMYGLEQECFSSVDLVDVSNFREPFQLPAAH